MSIEVTLQGFLLLLSFVSLVWLCGCFCLFVLERRDVGGEKSKETSYPN